MSGTSRCKGPGVEQCNWSILDGGRERDMNMVRLLGLEPCKACKFCSIKILS